MTTQRPLDCVVIGYNDVPFEEYEQLIRRYGEHSEAYRDLKHSFIDLGGKKLSYVGLLNLAAGLAAGPGQSARAEAFKSGDIPSLAAVYLTNFLARRGHNAKYVNLFQDEKEKLADYLDQDPLCVAITTTLYVLNLPARQIVEFIRKHNPRVKIIVGGPLIANHARNNRQHQKSNGGSMVSLGGNYETDEFAAALSDIGADIYVIEGQGEMTLSRIVECLKTGGDMDGIPNLAYWQNGRLRSTPEATENSSLDEEFIDWSAFAGEGLGTVIQTRTARSCAFKCSFCNYPTRAGKLALAGLGTIEKELDSMKRLETVKTVVFIDDTFNVPLPRFKDICRLMIKKDYRFDWYSYFRCSNSDQEAIDLMARSGCKGVFLGIESGSPAILENMDKAATIERYADGIKILKNHGILTFGSFILGFPGETEETVAETVAFIKNNGLDYYRVQPWYCEPGTPILRHREKYQIEGEGFVWSHSTMDSGEAMDHVERIFLGVNESLWLPQWSFDFWIIPYLIGKGLSFDQFREFVALAGRLLSLGVAYMPAHKKQTIERGHIQSLVEAARGWDLRSN
jgi:p-methyltransferase